MYLCRAWFPHSAVARCLYLLWYLLPLQPNKMKTSSCLALFPVPSRGALAAGTQHPGINFDLISPPTSLQGQTLLSIPRHCCSGSFSVFHQHHLSGSLLTGIQPHFSPPPSDSFHHMSLHCLKTPSVTSNGPRAKSEFLNLLHSRSLIKGQFLSLQTPSLPRHRPPESAITAPAVLLIWSSWPLNIMSSSA